MPDRKAGRDQRVHDVEGQHQRAEDHQLGLPLERTERDAADQHDVHGLDDQARENQQLFALREVLQHQRRENLHQVGGKDKHRHQPDEAVVRAQQKHQSCVKIAAHQVGHDVVGVIELEMQNAVFALFIPEIPTVQKDGAGFLPDGGQRVSVSVGHGRTSSKKGVLSFC